MHDLGAFLALQGGASVAPGALFLVAILAGFVGSMTGMGGGVVLVPALTLLGVDTKYAIAISMVSVIATSNGSASAHMRDRITNVKAAMYLQIFTIVGSILGAGITLAVGSQFLAIVFGAILLASGVSYFIQRNAKWKCPSRQDGFTRWLELQGTYHDVAEKGNVDYLCIRAYIAGPLMFVAGLIAGLLGIGAGALKVLVLDMAMGLPSKVSTTTSNLIIGVTALAGASVYLAAGLVEPGLAAPVILGVLSGAYVGTQVLVRLSNKTVRYIFMAVLLVLGVQMIVRAILGG